MKKVSKVNSKVNTKSKKEFERYLEKIESPDYPWVAKDLPNNASSLEKAKFAICQEFVAFKFRNQLTTPQIARKIHLNKDETQKLLFCWIEKFSLDELVSYADKLFAPSQVKVTVQPQKTSKTIHVRTI